MKQPDFETIPMVIKRISQVSEKENSKKKQKKNQKKKHFIKIIDSAKKKISFFKKFYWIFIFGKVKTT